MHTQAHMHIPECNNVHTQTHRHTSMHTQIHTYAMDTSNAYKHTNTATTTCTQLPYSSCVCACVRACTVFSNSNPLLQILQPMKSIQYHTAHTSIYSEGGGNLPRTDFTTGSWKVKVTMAITPVPAPLVPCR